MCQPILLKNCIFKPFFGLPNKELLDFKVPNDLSAGHLCLQDCWGCVGSSMSIHGCLPHEGEVPTWEGGVEEWGIIPNMTPDLTLANLAQFSSLACVLPPLPANPLWDASGPWLSPSSRSHL